MKKILGIFVTILITCHGILQAQVIINPCAQATDIHVVVIGSSTAAGAGPLNSANAWVNRYRTYLQAINPNNQVTNLAVGGTTTYHIMPDWFVAPANRPSVTPAKNVSQAITLGADAIIVNMPSNDAANGFGVNEQMFNFQMISSVADSAGIPVWICTTQPKNFSTAQKAIQTAVRDSIFSYFGPKAIDFWTGFADATDGLATFYDSGDGTHMNDTAHAELNQRVIAAEIPNLVTDTLSYTDHVINDIYLSNTTSNCGDSNSMLHVVVTNLGANSTVSESLVVRFLDNVTSNVGNIGVSSISQLGSCQSDTLDYGINSYNGLDQSYHAYLNMSSDNDISNDTSKIVSLFTKGHPSISGSNDTVLTGANALLTATTGTADTIVWYDAMTAGNILGYGNSYPINNVTANQTVYPEAVRGPLHFANSLFTTATTSTNWNGIMFNIVALSDIVIDSLQIKVNSTGTQGVVGHYRLGSIVGNEMNASAWTPWGTDTVNAINPGEFKTIDFTDINLQTNDTLGVYVHMQNQGATLSYQNSAAAIYSNAEIQVQDGTGSAYTFGTTYSPRNWSGEVFYHYGFNPNGDCASERIPVSAIIRFPSLGHDIDKLDLNIYPNPTSGILQFAGSIIPKKVQISNMQGQLIKSMSVDSNQVDLENLSSGLYLLSFEVEGVNYTRKIMLR